MAKVPTVKARDEFSEVINRAAYGKERVVLTRRGKELAAVVPIEDVRFLQDLEDRIDLESARDALKESGTVAWKQLKKELGL
jgi:prevent-host-death family protein